MIKKKNARRNNNINVSDLLFTPYSFARTAVWDFDPKELYGPSLRLQALKYITFRQKKVHNLKN
jgi:hypothetical protein